MLSSNEYFGALASIAAESGAPSATLIVLALTVRAMAAEDVANVAPIVATKRQHAGPNICFENTMFATLGGK